MQLTYFGHSAFQIETNGTTLLFDPFISENKHAKGRVTPDDLSPDVLLLTHAHGDHFGDCAAILKRTGALLIGNAEIASYLEERHGHSNSHAMNTGGSAHFPWGRVSMMYARHSSSFPDGTYGGNPNGYLLEIEGKRVYNTGDTDAFSEMAWIGEDGGVDLCLMPVGDCFTMGTAGSIRAARMIKPRLIVPIHYSTFPPIEIDVSEWEKHMQEAGFATKVMRVPESLTF